jgi:hypothetical protein
MKSYTESDMKSDTSSLKPYPGKGHFVQRLRLRHAHQAVAQGARDGRAREGEGQGVRPLRIRDFPQTGAKEPSKEQTRNGAGKKGRRRDILGQWHNS